MAILLGYIGIYDMGVLITRMHSTIWFSRLSVCSMLQAVHLQDVLHPQAMQRCFVLRLVEAPDPILGLKPRGSSVPSPFRIQPA